MRPRSGMPGELIGSRLKFCADYESAGLAEIGWLVFAQSFKKGPWCNHFETKITILGDFSAQNVRASKGRQDWAQSDFTT